MSYCNPCCNGILILAKKQAQFITHNIKMSWSPQIVSKECLQDIYNIVPKEEDSPLQSDGANSCSAFLTQLLPNFVLWHFADFIALVTYTLDQPGGLFK